MLYQHMDQNGDGLVSRDEFKNFADNLKSNPNATVIRGLLRSLGLNGNLFTVLIYINMRGVSNFTGWIKKNSSKFQRVQFHDCESNDIKKCLFAGVREDFVRLKQLGSCEALSLPKNEFHTSWCIGADI